MWGALGTQPGERLAGRADGVNPRGATLPDPFPGVAPAGLLRGERLVRVLAHGSKARGRSLGRGLGVAGKPWPSSTSLSAPTLALSVGLSPSPLSVPLEGDSGSPLW